MLNRMYSLAEQSANGTYDNNTDRAQLQKEVGALRTEINRIADSANFNGLKLLDGSMARIGVDWSATNAAESDALKSFMGVSILAEDKDDLKSFMDALAPTGDGTDTFAVSFTAAAAETFDGATITFSSIDGLVGSGYTVKVTDSNGADLMGAFPDAAAANPEADPPTPATLGTLAYDSGTDAFKSNHQVNFKITNAAGKDVASISYRFDIDESDITGTDAMDAALNLKTEDGLNLQIGDDANSWNIMNVSVNDIHAEGLGIANIDISEQGGAQNAMDALKTAINYVSDVRGGLGATQNRLDHTINNLSVMQENIQDAESTIRDTDVADEMMRYTKNSILVQSAQAMLAQANQQPQGVLQLLQ
jgi:flagellin